MRNFPYTRKKWKRLNRKCPECGTKFVTKDPHKIYCVSECKVKALRRRAKKV